MTSTTVNHGVQSIKDRASNMIQNLASQKHGSEAERKERDEQYNNARRSDAWCGFIHDRGKRYAECSFKTFETSTEAQIESVSKLKRFATTAVKNGSNLILAGPTGTGKDHLLASTVRESISHMEPEYMSMNTFRWTSGPLLFADLRDGMSTKQTEHEILSPLRTAKVLAISDLCLTTLSDWQVQAVYRVVDHRYNNMKPTWITANVANRQELEEATSRQIVDRLTDGALYVPCDWKSYRKPLPVDVDEDNRT